MKITKIAAVILCCASCSLAVVCPTDYSEWKGGCSAEISPESAAPVKPSHGDAPRHPQPAWERGEVKIIEIRAFATESEEADAQVKFAQLHSTGKPSGLNTK